MIKNAFLYSLSFLFYLLILGLSKNVYAAGTETPCLGVWVTVFSPEKVLDSKENTDKLIETCKACGIRNIYIQLYRADTLYYGPSLTDNTLQYLIDKAKENGIKVHAWVNLLSLAQNKDANILKKFGDSVITRDQLKRTSLRDGNKDRLDKYYIRENQLFLEPGDERVRQYLVSIIEDIIRKHPSISGVHLDYVRYPFIVPITLGSRFTSHGISYGFTEANLGEFTKNTGLDARTMKYSIENFEKWDNARRDNVTRLVQDISKAARAISPKVEISCTIVPSVERTYLVTFQDWTRWLKEGYADYVVAMNYTADPALFELNTKSLRMEGFQDKVYIGVGAHLLKNNLDIFKKEIQSLQNLSSVGIVIFSYDDIVGNENLQNFLASNSTNYEPRTTPANSGGSAEGGNY